MPIRIASLTERISANGQALHRAMLSRIETYGAEHEPSEAEQALTAERQQLKEERDKRHAQAMQPKPTAAERLVRTHHPQAKDKPRAKKETKETKQVKPHKSRAEKHAAKAAALDAARRAKKPAK
jgi:hypothetical protein